MKLKIKTNTNNYSVIIGKNISSKINRILLKEKIFSQKFLFVYDSKVPAKMIGSIVSKFNKKKVEKKKSFLLKKVKI